MVEPKDLSSAEHWAAPTVSKLVAEWAVPSAEHSDELWAAVSGYCSDELMAGLTAGVTVDPWVVSRADWTAEPRAGSKVPSKAVRTASTWAESWVPR